MKFPPGVGFGAIFVTVGLVMMGAMALDQGGLNVPLWVAEVAAACFALAGGSLIAQAYKKLRLSRALSLGVVYALAVPGLWIGFGSDGSGCSGSVSLGPISFSDMSAGLTCRIVFGIGALVTLACAVGLTYAIIRGFGTKPAVQANEPVDLAD